MVSTGIEPSSSPPQAVATEPLGKTTDSAVPSLSASRPDRTSTLSSSSPSPSLGAARTESLPYHLAVDSVDSEMDMDKEFSLGQLADFIHEETAKTKKENQTQEEKIAKDKENDRRLLDKDAYAEVSTHRWDQHESSQEERCTKRTKIASAAFKLHKDFNNTDLDDRSEDQAHLNCIIENNQRSGRYGSTPGGKDGYRNIVQWDKDLKDKTSKKSSHRGKKIPLFHVQLGAQEFTSYSPDGDFANSSSSLTIDYGKQAQAAIFITEHVCKDPAVSLREKGVGADMTKFQIALPAGKVTSNGSKGQVVLEKSTFVNKAYDYKEPSDLIEQAKGKTSSDTGYPWPPAFEEKVRQFSLCDVLRDVVPKYNHNFKFQGWQDGQVKVEHTVTKVTHLISQELLQSVIDSHPYGNVHHMGTVHGLKFKVGGMIDTNNWDGPEFSKAQSHAKYLQITKSNLKALRDFTYHENREDQLVTIFWMTPERPWYSNKLQDYQTSALYPFLWAINKNKTPLSPYLKNGRLDINGIEMPWLVGPYLVTETGRDEVLNVEKVTSRCAIRRFYTLDHYRITMSLCSLREHQGIDQRAAVLRSHTLKASFIKTPDPPSQAGNDRETVMDGTASSATDKSVTNFDWYQCYIEYDGETRIKMKGVKLEDGMGFGISFQVPGGDNFTEFNTMEGRVIPMNFDNPIWQGKNKRKIDVVLSCSVPKNLIIQPECQVSVERVLHPNSNQTRVLLEVKETRKSMKAMQAAMNALKDSNMARKANVLMGNVNANKRPVQMTPEAMCFPFNIESNEAAKFKTEVEKFNNGKTWGLNAKQTEIILLQLEHRPFNLIQGPPGTGKTKTLCGLALSTLCAPSLRDLSRNIQRAPKILISAPSNVVVDLIVERLMEMQPKTDTTFLNPLILRHHVPGAESRFARMTTAEVDEYFQKASTDDILEEVTRMTSMENYGDALVMNQLNDILLSGRFRKHKLIKSSTSRQMISVATRTATKLRTSQNNGASLSDPELEQLRNCQRFVELIESLHDKTAMAPHWPEWFKVGTFVRRLTLSLADIIVTTTVNSAQDELVDEFRPDLLIVDDAARGMEAETILPICLFKSARQVFLFGDHKQLGPTITNTITSEVYDQSIYNLFGRLIDLGVDSSQLDTQYRMNADISALVSDLTYMSKLKNGSNVLTRTPDAHEETKRWRQQLVNFSKKYKLNKMLSMNKLNEIMDVAYIDTSQQRSSMAFRAEDSYSKVNYVEAKMTASFVVDFLTLKHNIPTETITVVAMYKAQLDEIRKCVEEEATNITTDRVLEEHIREKMDRKKGDPVSEEELVAGNRNFNGIQYSTVDNIQGGESDFVVLNLVATGDDISGSSTRGEKLGTTSFMRSPNRLNVALSRAKYGIAIFGNAQLLRKSMNSEGTDRGTQGFVLKILDWCKQKGCFYSPSQKGAWLSAKAIALEAANHSMTKKDHVTTNLTSDVTFQAHSKVARQGSFPHGNKRSRGA